MTLSSNCCGAEDRLFRRVFLSENYCGNAGLTKREHFAALALQGLIAKYSLQKPEDQQLVCQMAVELSDSLIKELNQ